MTGAQPRLGPVGSSVKQALGSEIPPKQGNLFWGGTKIKGEWRRVGGQVVLIEEQLDPSSTTSFQDGDNSNIQDSKISYLSRNGSKMLGWQKPMRLCIVRCKENIHN